MRITWTSKSVIAFFGKDFVILNFLRLKPLLQQIDDMRLGRS
jgi:hypothetical protein